MEALTDWFSEKMLGPIMIILMILGMTGFALLVNSIFSTENKNTNSIEACYEYCLSYPPYDCYEICD